MIHMIRNVSKESLRKIERKSFQNGFPNFRTESRAGVPSRGLEQWGPEQRSRAGGPEQGSRAGVPSTGPEQRVPSRGQLVPMWGGLCWSTTGFDRHQSAVQSILIVYLMACTEWVALNGGLISFESSACVFHSAHGICTKK